MTNDDILMKLKESIFLRLEHDKAMFGEAFIEVIYDKTGLLKRIEFGKDENKWTQETECFRCHKDTTDSLCAHGYDWCCDCYEETYGDKDGT